MPTRHCRTYNLNELYFSCFSRETWLSDAHATDHLSVTLSVFFEQIIVSAGAQRSIPGPLSELQYISVPSFYACETTPVHIQQMSTKSVSNYYRLQCYVCNTRVHVVTNNCVPAEMCNTLLLGICMRNKMVGNVRVRRASG